MNPFIVLAHKPAATPLEHGVAGRTANVFRGLNPSRVWVVSAESQRAEGHAEQTKKRASGRSEVNCANTGVYQTACPMFISGGNHA